MDNPCDWPARFDACGALPEGQEVPATLAGLPDSGESFIQMARDYLWRWSGQRYGLCETTVRPCAEPCTAGVSTFGTPPGTRRWTPVLVGGQWFNIGCGRCGDTCGCGDGATLRLPGPIASVGLVTVDDEPLPPGSYYVQNHTVLIRTDGRGWPDCGVEVTYTRGTPVPTGGQVAAGVLAVELAKAACDDSTCALPKRIQTVSRQGVTVAMLDSFDDVERGHTGIWIIDSWLASVTKAPTVSRVLSPDTPSSRVRRTTWGVR